MTNIIDLLIAEQRIYEQSIEDRTPTYSGVPRQRFRWSRFRFEWGRWHCVSHWCSYKADIYWWEWLGPNGGNL